MCRSRLRCELNPATIDWSRPRVNEAYYLRQDPGPGNSLGSLKINFPNSDSIFLHDTPTKTLFGRQERNFSSGCVRVQNVRHGVRIAWTPRCAPANTAMRN